jgi:transcriptional regulator with XRE-family HTH domain
MGKLAAQVREQLRNGSMMDGFGLRLRTLREVYQAQFPRENHDQAQWAARLGVTAYKLSRWESGQHLPKLLYLHALKVLSGVSWGYLMAGELDAREMEAWLYAALRQALPELQDVETTAARRNKAVAQIRRDRMRLSGRGERISS